MPSLGLGLGTHVTRSLIDPDVAAFAAESGATDTAALNTLTEYLKEESLYDNFVIYPMKSAQNAGSGSTVYSLGGKTDNDITLTNSPTWGVSGITFNGTNQYGSVTDFVNSDTLTIFARNEISGTSPGAGNKGIVTQYNGTTDRAFLLGYNYAASTGTSLLRTPNGTAAAQEAYENEANTLEGSDITAVAQWVDGGGRSLWHDKSAQSLVLFAGSPATAMFNETVPILINAVDSSSPTGFNSTVTKAVAFHQGGALSTTQREQITDLINAL